MEVTVMKKPSKSKASKARPKKPQKSPPKIGKSYVLFGLDENEKPRGARFGLDDEALLTRMATGLGLRIGFAAEARQLAVVRQLPRGDVHATGTKAVPNIEQDLPGNRRQLIAG
jgi:hypothetical protein